MFIRGMRDKIVHGVFHTWRLVEISLNVDGRPMKDFEVEEAPFLVKKDKSTGWPETIDLNAEGLAKIRELHFGMRRLAANLRLFKVEFAEISERYKVSRRVLD